MPRLNGVWPLKKAIHDLDKDIEYLRGRDTSMVKALKELRRGYHQKLVALEKAQKTLGDINEEQGQLLRQIHPSE